MSHTRPKNRPKHEGLPGPGAELRRESPTDGIESIPIPAIAQNAAMRAAQAHQHAMNVLAGQTLEAMGLAPSDGWRVDFGTNLAVRRVPGPASASSRGVPLTPQSPVLKRKRRKR